MKIIEGFHKIPMKKAEMYYLQIVFLLDIKEAEVGLYIKLNVDGAPA